jgi:hypothetical protein
MCTKDKKCGWNRGTLHLSLKIKQGESLSPILFNLALQKEIKSIKMVPSGIKIGKEQLNTLAYADDIVLIGKNEI